MADFKMVLPVLLAFVISVILGPIIIPYLRKLKMGQTERTEGVQSHLKKAGTPTMGGIIFLLSTVITSIFFVKDYPKIIPVLFLTLGFGVIGFLDDYLKVVLKRSDGLMPGQKMACQIVVTAVFAFYLVNFTDVSLAMKIPFVPGYELNLGNPGDTCAVYRSDRYSQRGKLYRWPGWSGFLCDHYGGYVLFCGGYWDKQRDRADYLCGGRSAYGISAV